MITIKLKWSGETDGFTLTGETDVGIKFKSRGKDDENDDEESDKENETGGKSKGLAGTITASEGGVKFTSATLGNFINPFNYSPFYSYALLNGIGPSAGVLPPSTEQGNQPSVGLLFGGLTPGASEPQVPPRFPSVPMGRLSSTHRVAQGF